jgi:hypothetical protein
MLEPHTLYLCEYKNRRYSILKLKLAVLREWGVMFTQRRSKNGSPLKTRSCPVYVEVREKGGVKFLLIQPSKALQHDDVVLGVQG